MKNTVAILQIKLFSSKFDDTNDEIMDIQFEIKAVSLIILYIIYVAKTHQRSDGMYGVSGSRRCRGRRRRRC